MHTFGAFALGMEYVSKSPGRFLLQTSAYVCVGLLSGK